MSYKHYDQNNPLDRCDHRQHRMFADEFLTCYPGTNSHLSRLNALYKLLYKMFCINFVYVNYITGWQ